MAINKKPKLVIISPQAQSDIENILIYLKQNWSDQVVQDFLNKLRTFLLIVSINPRVFGYYNKRKNIRNFAVTNQNIIFYRNRKNAVEIITVFDGRQSPTKLKKLVK